ncbi:SPOR domain-containing protein [Zobellella maritima]|uniref:SPOR domain-containing protein n=1 Tax=Zobellella maritima TaxID=2059725 RepID=UPI000E309143|nr:SPOR domain-containing protein [Zobellella maritima]
MAERHMGKGGYTRLLERWWVKVVLTGVVVLLLVALILGLQGRKDSPEPRQVASSGEQPVDNRQPEQRSLTGQQDQAGETQAWPEQTLPASPEIDTLVAETPDDSDKERVVIEDKVVRRLLERGQDPTTGRVLVPAPSSVKPAEQAAMHTSAMSLLSDMSPERYTLQLRAGRNLAALDQLVLKHTLTPAWIYPKAVDDKPWFVLVFGNFDSAEQARRAVAVLPFELQSAKPWPKTFGQVQKEAKP